MSFARLFKGVKNLSVYCTPVSVIAGLSIPLTLEMFRQIENRYLPVEVYASASTEAKCSYGVVKGVIVLLHAMILGALVNNLVSDSSSTNEDSRQLRKSI